MKTCSSCGKELDYRTTRPVCKPCGGVCPCGKKKDFRASHCKACANSLTARVQWAKEGQREIIRESIVAAGFKRRKRKEDLTWESFNAKKLDGRRMAYYWEDDGKRRYIYRYRWLWEQTYGPIPEGMEVHHKNRVSDDDRIENLELLTNAEHRLEHANDKQKPELLCAVCGCKFRATRLKRGKPRLHCSKACGYIGRSRIAKMMQAEAAS